MKFSDLKCGRAFSIDTTIIGDSLWIKITKTQAIRLLPKNGSYHQSCSFRDNPEVYPVNVKNVILNTTIKV